MPSSRKDRSPKGRSSRYSRSPSRYSRYSRYSRSPSRYSRSPSRDRSPSRYSRYNRHSHSPSPRGRYRRHSRYSRSPSSYDSYDRYSSYRSRSPKGRSRNRDKQLSNKKTKKETKKPEQSIDQSTDHSGHHSWKQVCPVCPIWEVNGSCSKKDLDCPFEHPQESLTTHMHTVSNSIDCFNWLYGRCSDKEECPFTHNPEKRSIVFKFLQVKGVDVDVQHCIHWMNTECPHGNKCEFAHHPNTKEIFLGTLKTRTAPISSRNKMNKMNKMNKLRDCDDWMGHGCKFRDDVCDYTHDPAKKGSLKRFLPEPSKPSGQTLGQFAQNKNCRDWMTKGCRYTDEGCDYKHDPPKKGILTKPLMT